jgi:ubiquinone biosynthesis protein UbiJ
MNLATAIAPVLEITLNAFLALDPEAAERLAPISSKLIALEIIAPEITLVVRPLKNRVQVRGTVGFEPDAVIRGSPLSLARLGLSSDTAALPHAEGIEIRGDAEAARAFGEVLAGIEIDWEELLARRVGDIPAHQAGNALRGLAAGLINNLDKLRMDFSEYLQEEARVTPTRIEVAEFMDEVDQLRSELDRLEARIERVAGTASEADSTRPRGG